MLASKVVFGPRLRGTDRFNRSPFWASNRTREPARYGYRTRRRTRASRGPPLRPPSPSRRPLPIHRVLWPIYPFFLVAFIRFMARHTVERLTSKEATVRRYSHLC